MGVIDESAVTILMDTLADYKALLIGPGFGRDDATKAFLEELLGVRLGREQIGFLGREAQAKPARQALPACVVDADGLKLLRKIPDWPNLLPPSSVLTPHPGEMAFLTGEAKQDLQQDRVASARRWAEKWGHIVLLKGANSVVAEPGGRTAVVPIATSALASAGTGDVLSGMIVGLLAQGLGAYEAAVLGAYLHGRAGLLAQAYISVESSVVAGDVVDAVPAAIAELRARTKRI
jgi:NAD(P)H-hydrate epimerase